MTGGGTATVAYLHEPVGNYGGAPTDSDYKAFGRDQRVTDLSFDNALQRLRNPADPEAVETIATTFEGAFSVECVLGNPWWLNHLLGDEPVAGGEASAPYSYTWTPTTGRVQSARVYVGVDYLNGTTERQLEGVVFTQADLSLSIGEPVTLTLTGFYGSETPNASLTPGSAPEEQATPLVFHSGSLEIPNSSVIAKPQDATLAVSTGARPHRGWEREPVDAVIGGVETDLSLSAIITDTSQRDLAYGGSGGPQDRVSGAADATLAFTTPGATGLTANLAGVTPGSYAWSNVGDPDADVLEDIDYTVENVELVGESDQDTAR
jgi:hypothetical protein